MRTFSHMCALCVCERECARTQGQRERERGIATIRPWLWAFASSRLTHQSAFHGGTGDLGEKKLEKTRRGIRVEVEIGGCD